MRNANPPRHPFSRLFSWLLPVLLIAAGTLSCRSPSPARPDPLPDSPRTKSQTFQARSDIALAATTVVGVRWSSILFEKPDAMSRAFPDQAVFEILQPL